MLRKKSEAVSEGNGPTPQDASKIITWEEIRQAVSETWGEAFREHKKDLRRMDERLASLEQNARQPRFAMEADMPANNKTRERTEGATKAAQAMHGDSFPANKVQAGPTTSASFGVEAEHLALPCRDDVLAKNGAAAPKSCLSPWDMRTTTATGGLLPPAKPLKRQGPPSPSQIFGSA